MTKLSQKYQCKADLFLPINRSDMRKRGWDELDFLLVCGDAYVDHPSFGHAVIAHCLYANGYRVGIVSQPDWKSKDAFGAMGRPRLGVMVSAGNLDSMLSNYSSLNKKRRTDDYAPGGKAGCRPDRATIVYCNRIRELWGDIPIVIGGIEASLRRVAHYDYWSDSVRRSILVDSRADILVFGMAELASVAIADSLAQGRPVSSIRDVAGTCWKTHSPRDANDALVLPSYDDVLSDKKTFAKAFLDFSLEQDAVRGKRLIQDNGSWYVVCNKPSRPLTESELDKVYSYPYAREWHPSYNAAGGVPALSEVKFSITSHRGCFGECSFCAIAFHQGRVIQRRSDESMLLEAKILASMPDFKGYIHDVGGPTANFTVPSCKKQLKEGVCRGKSCLHPAPCKNLEADHSGYIELLRKLRNLQGVKKVFIRSGIRYDYMMLDRENEFLNELCCHHISGQLKIAPEHVSPYVLSLMKKPKREVTEKFVRLYREVNFALGQKQFLVPYFMSSHPGAELKDALLLALYIKESGLRPEQVQDFTPTPGSASTCMYYTGLDPFTGKEVYSAKSYEERRLQRALLQFWILENAPLVKKALEKLDRADLIGKEPECLVR